MTFTTKNKRFSITTEMKQICFIPSFGITYKKYIFSNGVGFKHGIAFMFLNVNAVFRFGKVSENNE